MKKYLSIIMLTVICIFGCSCYYTSPGDVSNVKITSVKSDIYSEEDINSAVDVVKDYFKGFRNCTLQEVGYVGDDEPWLSDMQELEEKYDVDEVIILISNFYSGEHGEDIGLEPNFPYLNYIWILERNKGGQWEHKSHGYY